MTIAPTKANAAQIINMFKERAISISQSPPTDGVIRLLRTSTLTLLP